MNVRLVGCSHHKSPLAVRERLAFTPDGAEEALNRLRSQFPSAEAVVLSTCNRVEIYTVVESPEDSPTSREIAQFLAEFHGLSFEELFDVLVQRSGGEAVTHLFSVAAGLDSMVLGEPQILSQVKSAYEMAQRRESTGPVTHGVFQAAMKAAKRVATETKLTNARVSIPSVAIADFARQIFESFEDKRVLVVGAGEMAEETLRYLRSEGARQFVVLNRSHDRGKKLANEFNAQLASWDQLHQEFASADLVVTTTGAKQTILGKDEFMAIENARYQQPLFILDLAVPRDVDPAVGEFPGVYLYSLDDLQATCKENMRKREKEIPAALAIVRHESDAFMADLNRRATGPIIKRLREGWQQPKDDELRRLLNRLGDLDDASKSEIAQSFDRLINKLLHPPLESIRDESRHGIPHSLLDALRKLFQLKD
ncbi:MAG: glutamyl-tRNA reductase [Pirellulales bacterium]|nr:glutamyl-tRNA reductase [Pirellulales bacterium]